MAIAIAATIIVLASVTSARSRIAASTSTNSLLEAGRIDLIVEPDSDGAIQTLIFDRDGMYPGQVLSRCLGVTYEGTFDTATIRLHGEHTAGTGLGAYLDVTVERGFGRDSDCEDFLRESVLFAGRLDDLLAAHTNFDSGILLTDTAVAGQRTMVRIAIEVVDDNDAQDRTTRFLMSFEVRP